MVPSLTEDEVADRLGEAADAYENNHHTLVRRIADALTRHEYGIQVHPSIRWWLRVRVQEFAVIEYALARQKAGHSVVSPEGIIARVSHDSGAAK